MRIGFTVARIIQPCNVSGLTRAVAFPGSLNSIRIGFGRNRFCLMKSQTVLELSRYWNQWQTNHRQPTVDGLKMQPLSNRTWFKIPGALLPSRFRGCELPRQSNYRTNIFISSRLARVGRARCRLAGRMEESNARRCFVIALDMVRRER